MASLLFRPCGPSRQPGTACLPLGCPQWEEAIPGRDSDSCAFQGHGLHPQHHRVRAKEGRTNCHPITSSAGTTLPIWAQGPHVTSRQTEAWTGQDREARCQLLAGTRSFQEPRPWLLSDFFFLILIEGYLLYDRVLVSALHHDLVGCDKRFVIPDSWS